MQVKLSAVDYGRVAGQEAIADIDSVVFENIAENLLFLCI